MKNKKGISIVNAFNKIIKQSNRKPNKIWVDQGGEFYNNVFEKWLSDNDINMYSTYNEGKSVVAERFIRTLKNKLYKHMTATGKNVYYDVLDDVVNKYNNTKHSTIKMKPIDVKNKKGVYIDEHNEKDSKFKVGDRVRISRYKNIFAKRYAPNWSSEIFIVDKINDTVTYTYNLKDLNAEEIIGSFYDNELQKTKFLFADNYKMSYYPPYKSSSNNVKVELDLTNYATKTDLKNITHVDVSSFASKTNLAALKTEVDKIDADKLKTTPTYLAKLTNAVEHDVVKKTDYNTKVTSIEAQIAGLTKNTVDNLADITKLKAIDTNSFVTRTKFSADTNALDDKIDGVEKKYLI